MQQHPSPRELRDEIVGRTIAGVIARPGRTGEPPVVLMMRFDDGSVIEFVSPRSDRLLKRSLRSSAAATTRTAGSPRLNESQLTLDNLLLAGKVDDAPGRYGLSMC